MHKLLLRILLVFASITSHLWASAEWDPPKIDNDSSILGHIFLDKKGHLKEDTPENRAFIESAASNANNKVGTNRYGVDIYMAIMPDGSQSWAHVLNNSITNGGKNSFPKQWIPDDSRDGGRFVTPKFSHYKASRETFKSHLAVNNIQKVYEVVSQTPQFTSMESTKKIEGVAGNYGKIVNLIDDPEQEGTHTIYIPTYELTQLEALQILRDVARGVYVYGDLPFFSLHFNRSLTSYPVIPPVYRSTLVGEALGMLDYYMKGFTNGWFFERDFIDEWNGKRDKSKEHFEENAIDYHKYCEGLGFHYRTFNEILEEVMGGESPKGIYKNYFTISYQLVFNQKAIYKKGDALSYDGGFNVFGTVEGTPLTEEEEHYAKLVEACSIMCEQIEKVLPKLPICKKHFEVLYLANFYSYYCNSLKEVRKIPMIDKALADNDASCPEAFPPLPVSMEHELHLPLMSLFEAIPRTRLATLRTYLNAEPAPQELINDVYDVIYEGIETFMKDNGPTKKLSADQCGDLTFEILQYCKKRHQAFKRNLLTLFKGTPYQGAMSDRQKRSQFFQDLNHLIHSNQGSKRQEFINVRDATTKWFADPLIACFEDSGFLFSQLDGSIKFCREGSDGSIRIAGGCGVTVEDLEAQHSSWLGFFHRGISVESPYKELEIEEGENPEAVASGYLYPPLGEHPLDHVTLKVLEAIENENLVQFEKCCAEIKDWNFKDPMRVSLVHHASRCQNPTILKKLIEKGADLKVFDSQGFTPLHYAAQSDSIQCIDLLMNHCPKLIELQGENGETPLFFSVQYQARKAMNALIRLGANLNISIINDYTPLLWAIQSKDSQTAMSLLAYPNIDFDHTLRNGNAALELAIHTQQTQILKKLIQLGANVNRKNQGYTPLHLAISLNYIDGVKTLIGCSDTILTMQTPSKETPMQMAQRLGYQEIITLLRNKGL